MEKEKLQQLDNLLLALGFSDTDEKLQNCINKYLLTLLQFFRFQNQVISNKVLEILSTINQRIKHAPNIKLPLEGLIGQFYDKDTPFIQKNFTLIYLFNGFERVSLEEKYTYINKLLVGISQQNPLHQSKLLGLALQTLSKKKIQRFTSEKEIEQMKDSFPFFQDNHDRKIILEFLFYFFLSNYSCYSDKDGFAEGLSIKWKKKLSESMKFSSENELDDMKIGMVNMLDTISPNLLSYQETILIILAAKADLNARVAKAGEDIMRRIDKVKINLEDPILVNRMYDLYLGTEEKNVAKEDAFLPVSSQFRLLILYQLRRSTIATNIPLRPVKVFLDALNGVSANMKSRQAALGFAQWMFHQASQPQIAFAGQIIFSYLLKLLRDLKDVKEEGSELYILKDMLLSLFSPICKRIPSLFTRNFETLDEILKMFMNEVVNFQVAMQDGLFQLTPEFRAQSEEFKEKLFGVIEQCARANQSPIARYLAVYYAIRIYPFSDVRCRFLCLAALSHSKLELREEAKKGLEPYVIQDRDIVSNSSQPYPPFPSAVAYINSRLSDFVSSSSEDPMNIEGEKEEEVELYSGSIRFLEKCYIQYRSQGDGEVRMEEEGDKEAEKKYAELIEDGFNRKREHGVHLLCAKALLYLASTSSFIAQSLSDRTASLKSSLLYLHHADSRDCIAKLLAVLSEHISISSLFSLLDESIRAISQYKTLLQSPASGALVSVNDEHIHGDLLLMGTLIGKLYYLHRYDSLSSEQRDRVSQSISLILSLIGDKNLLISTAAIQSIGTIARYSPLPLPLLPADDEIKKQEEEGEIKSIEGLLKRLRKVLARETTKEQLMEKIVLSIGDVYLGAFPLIERGSELERYTVDCIFALSKIKHEEVLFTAGEALSSIGSGWDSKASQSKLLLNENSSSFPSLSLSSEPMHYILSSIIRKYILSGNADERVAGAIWLLSVVQHSGLGHEVIRSQLPSIQRAFTHMLASSNDLVQEVGSKGLVIVYEGGDQNIQKDLVSSLVSTLSQGSKGFKSNAHGDAELFPPGMLGKTPDGSEGNLTTYKELSSLASEMGKPELMYKFLNLSSHHQIWSSKKGAAFATQSIMSSQLAKAQLQPYLSSLVPKLYRYSYDPNPRLAQSMSGVLNSIMDTSKLMDQYWDPIIKELMEGIGSRVWRVREASLLALPDAIRSRHFHDLAPYFEKLYTMVFRGMDDIKESVAKAGVAAAKSLAALTSRICDPLYTSPDNVRRCLEISIPFLIDQGLHNMADEVKLFSIETIHSITKSSGALITPFVPHLASVLLENLSLYEPAVLNYIDQKAEEFGTTKEELEDIRMKISTNAPLSKTIDLLSHHLDESTVKEMVEKLEHLISHGVGMPTKVGLSKFIQSLTRHHPFLITPHAPRLIRRLTSQLLSRSLAIRKSFATSISLLCKLSTPKSLTILLNHLSSLYIDKASSLTASDLALHGSAVALTLHELSKNASSMLIGGGKEGGRAVDCIPLCFLGTCDLTDSTNKELFQSCWNEIGVGGSEKLYTEEIIALISKCFASSSWVLRAQGAVALSKLSDKIGSHILPHTSSLLSLLLSHFKERRVWAGKEKLFLSFSSLVKSSQSFFLKDGVVSEQAVEIVMMMGEECSRGESEYKRQALTNLNAILTLLCPPLDCFSLLHSKITPLISSVSAQIESSAKDQSNKDLDQFLSSSSAASEMAESGKEKARKFLILAECFDLLGNAFPASLNSQLSHYSSTTRLLTSQLRENTWNIKIKILNAINKIIGRLDSSILLNRPLPSPVEGSENIIVEDKVDDINFVEEILESLKEQTSDAKYANVREAALNTLKSLTLRLSQLNGLENHREKIKEMLQHREREPPLQIIIKEILHYLN